MTARRILIVGGSTRAAADSVRRAGWKPICADLFADLDLRDTAEVISVHRYPESLPDDIAHVKADGWFYCGALENHPNIIQQIQANGRSYGTLLGSTPDSLRQVRNPIWLMKTLRSSGIPTLDALGQENPPVPDGTWLQKPLASAGGRSIRVWDRVATRFPLQEPHYFQRRAPGVGLSALFRIECGGIEWLGASRELDVNGFQPSKMEASRIVPPRDGAGPPNTPVSLAFEFIYLGSCGPLTRIPFFDRASLAAKSRFHLHSSVIRGQVDGNSSSEDGQAVFQTMIQKQLSKIAKSLVKRSAGLKGIVGLDFRFDGETVWLTEVNPRYTASVEMLELTSGRSFLLPNAKFDVRSAERRQPKVLAKRIIYAKTHLTAPDLSRHRVTSDPWSVPMIADIPVPGTDIEPGWPICTVFAEGTSLESVEIEMQTRVEVIWNALKGAASTEPSAPLIWHG